MAELPTPKRYVLLNEFTLYADEAVADFLRLLKPVSAVLPSGKDKYVLYLDPRYAYDDMAKQQIHAWLLEQLESEFANTKKPARHQNDLDT